LSPLARLHLALVMQDQGKLDGALAELDALSRDWPASTLPLEQKAGLLQAKGRAADAAAALDQAIARLPAHPQAGAWSLFYARAAARDGDGDCAACEADLLRALELSPEQPAVLNYLGYSWAERGVHLAEAQRMIEKAVRIDPNNGAIVDSLGWVMLRQGDQRNAVRLLERATELKPDDPTINGHLGDAYAAMGRQLEAQYQWRRVLLLNPEAADAARLRSKLDDTSHPSGAAEETAHAPQWRAERARAPKARRASREKKAGCGC
jgi:tetratricopeptide (TPR) repeat protein